MILIRINQESEIKLQPVLPTHPELERGDRESCETEYERKKEGSGLEEAEERLKERNVSFLLIIKGCCDLAFKSRTY